MYEPSELENYAEVLLWSLRVSRRVPLKSGDLVLVRFDLAAAPLAEALYARLMDAHLHPLCRMNPTSAMERTLFHEGSYGQVMFQQPGEAELYAALAGVVTILAPDSLDHLADIDPNVVDQVRRAELAERNVLGRRRRSGLVGAVTCLYPTKALAEAAGVGLEEYAALLARACYVNTANPVRQWEDLRDQALDIAAWLDSLRPKALRLESASSDLTVEPGPHRRFAAVDGSNMPGCEIYVAPDCRTTRGVYFSDQPSIVLGRVVAGARLEFQNGVAVRATAQRGEQFLLRRLYSDSGARRLGEFSLVDRRLSRVTRFMAHTLLDENLAGESGSAHIALGASAMGSYAGPHDALTPETEADMGFNASSLHWDLVNTEKKTVTAVLADGSTVSIYENGEFCR